MSKTPPADEQAAKLEQLLGAFGNLNDTMTQMVTGMKTRDGVRQLGTNPIPLITSATPLGNAGVASNSPGLLAGVNFRETAGVASIVNVLDGIDTAGAIIWTGVLPANGALSAWFLPGGISYGQGLFVQVAAGGGTVQGVLYRAPRPYGGQP